MRDLPGSSGAVLRGAPLAVLAGKVTPAEEYRAALTAARHVVAASGTADDLRELLDAIGLDAARIDAGRPGGS